MESNGDGLEKVSPYDPKAFDRLKEASSKYVKFGEGEQKTLWVSLPQNLTTSRFGEEKLMLRLSVVSIDGVRCDPPKIWDIGSVKLINQLKPILESGSTHYKLIVKRNLGSRKQATYTVVELKD